jgi:hypothetical protein
MSIDWHALGTVFAVSLVSTVGLVGFFTLGIVGLSRRSGGGRAAARSGAIACFAACAAAVVYGICLIVSK